MQDSNRRMSPQASPELHGLEDQQTTSSPPSSNASSPKSGFHRRSASALSLDLSSLPALSQPAPPSNTLLITQLNDLTLFHPASLATFRQHLNSFSPLHSFSPLKSFRRIICSFYDTESAVAVLQHLDGSALLGNVRARVYFGEPTPIGEQKKYLDRPDAGRLFFISPPPSPPVGWEMKEEDPPNKEVHANDLAVALGKLSGKLHATDSEQSLAEAEENGYKVSGIDGAKDDPRPGLPLPVPAASSEGPSDPHSPSAGGISSARTRSRSSTLIYDPEAHGNSPTLPAVMVEDTTIIDPLLNEVGTSDQEKAAVGPDDSPVQGKTIFAHTTRPPVELIENA